MKTRVPPLLDAEMMAMAGTTLTASATGPTFDQAFGAVLVAGQFADPMGNDPLMQMIVPVTAYNAAPPGDQVYALTVQGSPDGSTWHDVSRAATVAAEGVPATGGFMFIVFRRDARYVRLSVVLAGTAPSITLGNCYIDPMVSVLGGMM